jgi:protein arginine kinase activator
MVCERCKINDATIHLTEIIKNVKSEIHLCENCAREIGLNAKLSNFTLSIPEMLSFLDANEINERSDDLRCKTCNYSFIDFSKTGKLGCPDCYESFKDALAPTILSHHGEKKHIGKSPVYGITSLKEAPARASSDMHASCAELQRQLKSAVLEERYEDAAVLRDRIKEIMGE